ncbi:hypothetical protein JCM10213_007130 [Rhodosporidiobolus nylandii]
MLPVDIGLRPVEETPVVHGMVSYHGSLTDPQHDQFDAFATYLFDLCEALGSRPSDPTKSFLSPSFLAHFLWKITTTKSYALTGLKSSTLFVALREIFVEKLGKASLGVKQQNALFCGFAEYVTSSLYKGKLPMKVTTAAKKSFETEYEKIVKSKAGMKFGIAEENADLKALCGRWAVNVENTTLLGFCETVIQEDIVNYAADPDRETNKNNNGSAVPGIVSFAAAKLLSCSTKNVAGSLELVMLLNFEGKAITKKTHNASVNLTTPFIVRIASQLMSDLGLTPQQQEDFMSGDENNKPLLKLIHAAAYNSKQYVKPFSTFSNANDAYFDGEEAVKDGGVKVVNKWTLREDVNLVAHSASQFFAHGKRPSGRALRRLVTQHAALGWDGRPLATDDLRGGDPFPTTRTVKGVLSHLKVGRYLLASIAAEMGVPFEAVFTPNIIKLLADVGINDGMSREELESVLLKQQKQARNGEDTTDDENQSDGEKGQDEENSFGAAVSRGMRKSAIDKLDAVDTILQKRKYDAEDVVTGRVTFAGFVKRFRYDPNARIQ